MIANYVAIGMPLYKMSKSLVRAEEHNICKNMCRKVAHSQKPFDTDTLYAGLACYLVDARATSCSVRKHFWL